MAALLSALAFQTALAREGCKVVPLPGWDTHNRDAGHTPLTPNGVMIHHTGSDTTDPFGYAKNILWSGYAGLPGPLCHAGGAPDGTLILVGHGRANHAGGGDQASLDAVIADAAPLTGELRPRFGNSNGVDGNSRFYGLEIMYSGGHPMTPEQRVAAVKFAAALCRAHAWSAASVIGHKEWSSDKVDPGQCPMDVFRRDVAAALALPAGQWPNPTPNPAPAPPTTTDEDPMYTTADRASLVDGQRRASQAFAAATQCLAELRAFVAFEKANDQDSFDLDAAIAANVADVKDTLDKQFPAPAVPPAA